MNPNRLKALEGLLDYLCGLQGGDLKSLMDQPPEGNPLEQLEADPKEIPGEEVAAMEEPQAMDEAAPEVPEEIDGAQPSEDEIEELYKKFRK